MQLYERELFQLDDPVEKFLPEFSKIKVLSDYGSLNNPKEMMTIKNLLNHTAGLSYGWTYHPVDQKYYNAGLYDSKGSDDFISRVSNLPFLLIIVVIFETLLSFIRFLDIRDTSLSLLLDIPCSSGLE